IAYRIPGHTDPDTPALQLLTLILGQGESSRLNRAVVRNERLAVQTAAGIESRRGPGVLYAFGVANRDAKPDALTRSLEHQVSRLADDVTQAELAQARHQFRGTSTFGRQ